MLGRTAELGMRIFCLKVDGLLGIESFELKCIFSVCIMEINIQRVHGLHRTALILMSGCTILSDVEQGNEVIWPISAVHV